MNTTQLRARCSRRILGWIPREKWGPVCAGCGDEQFCIDGYCSIECRDYHDDEDVAGLLDALDEAEKEVDEHKESLAMEVAENLRVFKALDLLTVDDFGHDTATGAILRRIEEMKSRAAALAERCEGLEKRLAEYDEAAKRLTQ